MKIMSLVPVLFLTVPRKADKVIAESNHAVGTSDKHTRNKVRPVDAKKDEPNQHAYEVYRRD